MCAFVYLTQGIEEQIFAFQKPLALGQTSGVSEDCVELMGNWSGVPQQLKSRVRDICGEVEHRPTAQGDPDLQREIDIDAGEVENSHSRVLRILRKVTGKRPALNPHEKGASDRVLVLQKSFNPALGELKVEKNDVAGAIRFRGWYNHLLGLEGYH